MRPIVHWARGLCHPPPMSYCICMIDELFNIVYRMIIHLPHRHAYNQYHHLRWHVAVHWLEVLINGWVRVRERCGAKLIRRLMRIRMNQSIVVQSGEFMEFLTTYIHTLGSSIVREGCQKDKLGGEGKRRYKKHNWFLKIYRRAVQRTTNT